MAGPINNPNSTPTGPAQSAAQQGPAQVGPRQTANPLQSSIDAMAGGSPQLKDIADLLTKIGELLAKNDSVTQSIRKTYKEQTSELRNSLAFIGEVETSTRKILEYQKGIRKDGIKAADYFGVLKVLREMEKTNKSQLEKGVFSDKQARVIRRNIDEIGKAIHKMTPGPGNPMSPETMKEVITLVERLGRETVRVSKNMKGVRLSSLSEDAASATRSLRHLFQMGEGTQKYKKYASTATAIRRAQNDHVASRHESAKDRRERILKSVPHEYLTSDSSRKDRRIVANHAAQEARREGMGRIGSRIFARHTVDTAMGKTPSVINRLGMNVLARGEGSIGHGIASMGLGALETGAGAVAELAGPLAPILAGFEAIKLAFDKNQVLNSDTANKLGGSGIYSSSGDSRYSGPLGSINQVRSNLNGRMYSDLGIGYDKNLAIAHSLQEAGFSNQNLSAGDLKKDGHGIVGGSFGSLQRNVYAYGRMAGLDSSQTMDQTIKLVTQYRQSLGSTEDFFIRINKDTRMAGMSTMKYIQLIDEVNSHYDRSQKLLEATVDTMRLLSVTGRNTAEDLKDAMDAATSGNPQRSPEVKAYLGQQLLSDPDATRRMQGVYDLNFNDSVGNVSRAMGPGYDSASLTKRIQEGGSGAIDQLLLEARHNATDSKGNVDTTQLQATSGALEKARSALQAQQVFNNARSQGATQGGLALGFGTSTLGDNILSQKMYNITGIETAMKQAHFSVGDALDPTRSAKMASDPLYNMFLQQMGSDPTKANKLISSMVYDSASARIKVSQDGMSNIKDTNSPEGQEQRKFLEDTYDLLRSKNATGLGNTGDKANDLRNFANSRSGESTMLGILTKDPRSLQDIGGNAVLNRALRPAVEKRDRDESMAQAAQLSAATRTSSEIFADAFTSLFNKLQTPLDFIAHVIARFSGSKGVSPDGATSQQMQYLDQVVGSGESAVAISQLEKKIQELEDQVAHPTAGKSADVAKKDLAEAKAAKDRIAAAQQAQKDPGQRDEELGGNIDQLKKDVAFAHTAGSEDAQQAVDAHAAIVTKAYGGLSPEQYKRFTDSSLNPATPTDTASSTASTNIYNTTHNLSVGYTQTDGDVRSAVNQSGEMVPLRKPN